SHAADAQNSGRAAQPRFRADAGWDGRTEADWEDGFAFGARSGSIVDVDSASVAVARGADEDAVALRGDGEPELFRSSGERWHGRAGIFLEHCARSLATEHPDGVPGDPVVRVLRRADDERGLRDDHGPEGVARQRPIRPGPVVFALEDAHGLSIRDERAIAQGDAVREQAARGEPRAAARGRRPSIAGSTARVQEYARLSNPVGRAGRTVVIAHREPVPVERHHAFDEDAPGGCRKETARVFAPHSA